MKKQKLVLTGLVGFAFLFGCNQVDDGKVEAGADTHKGFIIVSEDKKINRHSVAVVRHSKTGCNYIVTDGDYSGGLTQMFIEKDGVSVPYCDKVGE